MHKIFIGADIQESQLISFFYVQTDFLHHIVHMIIKYCTPIYGRKYHMVYQYHYVMTLIHVFAHIGILRRKRRGISHCQPFCNVVLGKSTSSVKEEQLMNRCHIVGLAGAALLFSLVYATPACAYLDPGTGSMIIQAVIAGIAAVSLFAGVFWKRLKSFFGRDKKDDSGDE
jgi:hypothetical protein